MRISNIVVWIFWAYAFGFSMACKNPNWIVRYHGYFIWLGIVIMMTCYIIENK
jgi:hypothetical protein